MSIKFNTPLLIGGELDNIKEVFFRKAFSGDGIYTRRCNSWLESHCNGSKALLTVLYACT